MMFFSLAAIYLAHPMLACPYGLSYDAVMKVLGISPPFRVKQIVFNPTEKNIQPDIDDEDQSTEKLVRKTQDYQPSQLFGLPSYAGLGHFSSGYSGLGYTGAVQG